MHSKDTQREEDRALAVNLARSAGDLLTQLRSFWTGDEADLRKAGDAEAQSHLAELLMRARPDDAVLSEEARDDAARLDQDRVWIIDPLDGTREYGEGRHDWAVHVALWEQSAGLRAVSLSVRWLSPAGDLC